MNWLSGFWKTIPTSSRNFLIVFIVIGVPKIETVPLHGFNNPTKILLIVDFPLPLLPTIQT